MPMNNLIMTRLARERDGVVSRRNNFAVAEHASASEEQSALLPTDTRSNFLKVSPADSGARNRGERDAICYRERFTLVRDSYRKLANELVTQLKLFEALEREEPQASIGAQLHWLRGEPRHQSES